MTTTSLELRSLLRVRDDGGGEIEVSLARVPVPALAPDQVLVRVEATPINPSDLGLLFGPVDPRELVAGTNEHGPTLTASVPRALLPSLAARAGQSLTVGNEGAGVVVDAGSAPEAQALRGRTVALLGGAMYAELRVARARDVLVLPEGTAPRAAASCFVNPLTALSMLETLRLEGHRALVHTAAASNLGQMLVKLCRADGVPLVNVVRSPAQVELLRGLGATHVLDSSSPRFFPELVEAMKETDATLAFDAIGGGKLAGQILLAMETAAVSKLTTYSRYGSPTPKQVYVYGALDLGPTELPRAVGLAWSVSGFLVTYFLQKRRPEDVQRMRARIVAELETTFASHYTDTISLEDALRPEVVRAYTRRATGSKYLVDPSRVSGADARGRVAP
jgi:NADPH:quinone reductase-like Zn-dependent oxidoreductase